MLFNSFEFFLFFSIVFVIYWSLKTNKSQNFFILLASYFFYSVWNWKFLGLLFFSTIVDYSFAFLVSKKTTRGKIFFWICVINNLLILLAFKYYNFFIGEFQHFFTFLGFRFDFFLLEIALPIGISFYTFHGLSYIIDIYRGQVKP